MRLRHHAPFLCLAFLAIAALAVRPSAKQGVAVPSVAHDDQKARYPAFEVGAIQPLLFPDDEPALWAINQPGNRLVKLDPLTLQRLTEIPIGLGAASVVARPHAGELWIADRVQGCITVVLIASGSITHTVRVGAEPHALCFSPSGDRAWVTCSGADRVDVVSTQSYQVVQSIDIPAREPRGIAFAAGRVWVVPFLSGNGSAAAGTSLDSDDARSIGVPHAPALTPLPDGDLFAIVPGALGQDALDPAATRTHLGTTLFNLRVRPGTSELWIPNTEALNVDHKGQTSFVDGRVVSNRITVVDLSGVLPTRVFDLDAIAPPGVRCAQPTDVAFDASGTRIYVCGYGSDLVAVLQPAPGAGVAWRGHINLPPRFGYPAGTAPRSCVVSPDGSALYVLNRNDVSIARIDLGSLPANLPFAVDSPLPSSLGFEASSGEERLGRHLFTDAHNSKSLTSSCASCHVDGHTDGLAWDLSSYADPASTPARNVQFGLDVKGPLVTQSTRRMEEQGPFHWRGEQHTLADFNDTFISLLDREVNGVPANVGADFQYLIHYIDRLAWPANPLERADRSLAPDEEHGAFLFQTRPVLGGLTCAGCHALPLGSSGEIVPATAGGVLHSVNVPALRGVSTKEGTAVVIGGSYGARPELGAGLTHAGVHATIEDAIAGHVNAGQPPFALSPADLHDLAAFVRAFDTGLAPATAFQSTSWTGDLTAFRRDLAYLQQQADARNCDVVVLRTPPPGAGPTFARTGMYVAGAGVWQLADSTLAPVDAPFLVDEASHGLPVTLVGVPLGAGRSHGLDRDMDGLFDVDEARAGTDPDRSDSDGDRFPDGYELQFGTDPSTYDASVPADTVAPQLAAPVHLVYATTNTLKIEFQTSEACRVHVHLNGGPAVQRVPLDHQVDDEHWVVLGNLLPGTAYTIGLEMRDPAGNIHTDSTSVFSTLGNAFQSPVHVGAMTLQVAAQGAQTFLSADIALAAAGGASAGPSYMVHAAMFRRTAAGSLEWLVREQSAPTGNAGVALVRRAIPAGSSGSTWYVVVTGVDAPPGAPPYVLAGDVLRWSSIQH